MRRLHVRRQEQGFSLVELLVVIVILGILAAVAIPVLVSQQRKAADATTKSDLRLVAGAIVSVRADGVEVTRAALTEGLRLSPGTAIAVHVDSNDWCLVGSRSSGRDATHDWVYESGEGLRSEDVVACGGTADFVLP